MYLSFVGLDIFTHNIWHLFSVNEIDWFGQKWRICDVVYSIGKSFVFLWGYVTFWLMWRALWSITTLEIAYIGDIISFNMIGLAINDLFKECTGGNFKLYYSEFILVAITLIITIFRLIKRFRK